MSFREVGVFEVREVLRLWERGEGLRAITRVLGVDRKTVRRYVEAARDLGVYRGGGERQLTEGLVGLVIGGVRPGGPGVHGEAWKFCAEQRKVLSGWLAEGLRLTKVQELLRRQTGEAVPYRTLHRFAVEELSFGKRRVTVRVEDGVPGEELQVDFGQMGRIREAGAESARVIYGLIFTACFSRHQFVWLTFTQAFEEVVEGFERAWEFFGGVFKVVIYDYVPSNIIQENRLRPPTKVRERPLVRVQKRLQPLVTVRPGEDPAAVAQDHREDVHPHPLLTQIDLRRAPVHLRLLPRTRLKPDRRLRLTPPRRPPWRDVIGQNRVAPLIATTTQLPK